MRLGRTASIALVSTLALRAHAQGGDDEDIEPNPLPKQISLPLESTLQFGVGPDGHLKYVLKSKSVFPMDLWGRWHLFHRPIVQILAQPAPKPGEDGAFGLGDLEYQLYVAPPATKDVIWGVGPDLWFPTATATALGTGKASVGLAAAARITAKPWATGFILTQYWSYAGDPDRSSVSQFTVQPHVIWDLPNGWYLTSSPLITANWKASSGDVWTIPVGAGGGKHFELGAHTLSVQLQGFYSVARPEFDGRWQLRLLMQMLFPRGA